MLCFLRMKKVSCFDCINSNCFIKKFCTSASIKEVDEGKLINYFPKKNLIFSEGNSTEGIYFILDGNIKIFKIGSFDRNQIIRFSSNGDFLGHRGFSSKNIYPVSAETISETYVCLLDKKLFFKVMEDSPKLALNMVLFLTDELNLEEDRLRDMAVFNVREKVASALLLLIEKFGINNDLEINAIENFSRQDIAEIVGINSNQVTKVFAEFKEDKIIDVDSKKIKVFDQKYLKRLVNY